MSIVTRPNIDYAINLIRTLKNIFKRKLRLTFTEQKTSEGNGLKIMYSLFPLIRATNAKIIYNFRAEA